MRPFALTITVAFLATITGAQEDTAQITPAPTGLPYDPTASNDTVIIYDTPLLPPDDENYVGQLEARMLAKRSPPAGVYICDNKNWLGNCKWVALRDSVCMDFPYDSGSSVGPPQGWQCKFYYTAPCLGPTFTDGKLTFPGTTNLGSLYNNYQKPTSIRCRPCPQGSACINNDAPVWADSVPKQGYMNADGKCYYWDGKWKWTTCIGYTPPATTTKSEKGGKGK